MVATQDLSYNTRQAAKTYFPNGYTMSLAMRRARRRYFWPNVRGCIVLSIFGGSIYFYSLEAVAQDDFDDLTALIPTPDEASSIPSLEELDASRAEKTRRRKQAQADLKITPAASPFYSPNQSTSAAVAKQWGTFGLGPKLSYYWPKDGEGGLIVGAPKVDELGRVGDVSAAVMGLRRI